MGGNCQKPFQFPLVAKPQQNTRTKDAGEVSNLNSISQRCRIKTMAAASSDLNNARLKLERSLGEENKSKYFHLLKQWFKMKSTREEFYNEARILLTQEQLILHNSFLLNLFNICQFPATTPVPQVVPKQEAVAVPHKASPSREKDKEKEKSKKDKVRPRKRTRSDRGFETADVAELSRPYVFPPKELQEPLRFVHEEFFLPDVSFILGRILLCAWDHGLDGGNEKAAEYLVAAVQHFLKNVLTAIFSQRSGYKVREGRFQHAMGSVIPNPWLKNTARIKDYTNEFNPTELDDETDACQVPGSRPTYEDIEQRVAFEMSCSTKPTVAKPPVSLFHVLETLAAEPSVIPSHQMYAMNVERIFAHLNHPSHEELAKDNL